MKVYNLMFKVIGLELLREHPYLHTQIIVPIFTFLKTEASEETK